MGVKKVWGTNGGNAEVQGESNGEIKWVSAAERVESDSDAIWDSAV